MKKLLIVGGNNKSDLLIKQAKEKGVFTVLTDNIPVEKSRYKQMADEAWDVSVTDIDLLEKKAREEGVTAITCGSSELCMSSVRELCKRMGLPFYVSDYAWEVTNSKIKFKEICKQLGIPVAKDFYLDINLKREDLDKIEYPVIVKPSNGSSSIGLHLCSNEKELIDGYKDAHEKSGDGQVVVEKYYDGADGNLIFLLKKGKAYLIESGDTFGYKKAGIPLAFANGPSAFLTRYEKDLLPKIQLLFEKLECEEGIATVQVVNSEKDFAVIEMNYRLPGGDCPMQEYMCKAVLDYVLAENKLNVEEIPAQKPIPAYFLWVKPGVIASVKGIEEIRKLPNILYVTFNLKAGDDIQPNSGLRQMGGIVTMFGTLDQARKTAESINSMLEILDEKGNNMLYKFSMNDSYKVGLEEE